MKGCVSIQNLNLLVDRLLESGSCTADKRKNLKYLVQSLKDCGYPLVELVDIISIAMMLDHILGDEMLSEANGDFISSSLDAIEYILSDRTYLKIDERIIRLEDDFYRNICKDSSAFEDKFLLELKKVIRISNNL